MSVTGTLGKVVLAGAAGGASIDITTAGTAATTLVFGGSVSDLSIATPGAIKALTVKGGWSDSDSTVDVISTFSLGSLKVFGDSDVGL